MYRVALIVKRSGAPHFSLLVTPSPPPPPPHNEDDAPLCDLPWAAAVARPASSEAEAQLDSCPVARVVHCALHNIGIMGLDAADAVCRLKAQLPPIWELMQPWKYWKFVEEPEYGPGPSIHTIFFMTDLSLEGVLPTGAGQWLNSGDAWGFLTGGNRGVMRVGPLATYAFSPHFPQGLQHKFNLTMKAQEYPPGILLLPLTSSTQKPFSKTNLVIFASKGIADQNAAPIISGEALIVDPGCHPIEAQKQLSMVVNKLPKKLFVFLTHHHVDHTEGLPTVYEQNPEAVILAHELTLRRLGKVAGKLKCLPITDGSLLVVGDQVLQVIAAPGHTDGHMALLHVPTHTLIVGDHCVGQGSSRLDADSGGSMQDYLTTTQKFLDLAPRVIVPMHGNFNLWPAHMLSSYIRHREAREAKILTSIEQGARTAFDIVSVAYSDTPPRMWMAALSNARLHVDHLSELQKLPQAFSMASFQKSCGLGFFLRCLGHSILKTPLCRDVFWKVSLALSLSSMCFLWARHRTNSS